MEDVLIRVGIDVSRVRGRSVLGTSNKRKKRGPISVSSDVGRPAACAVPATQCWNRTGLYLAKSSCFAFVRSKDWGLSRIYSAVAPDMAGLILAGFSGVSHTSCYFSSKHANGYIG